MTVIIRKRMIPLRHIEADITQRSGTNINTKTVGVFCTRNPVVLLNNVFAISILGMNQDIRGFGSRTHHIVRVVGGHRAQARGAMCALGIDRCAAINVVAHAKQTAFLTHIVETGLGFGANEAAIQHSDEDTSAIISHFVQDINFQLRHLGLGTTIIASQTAIGHHRFHFIGQPALLPFLCLQIVGAVAHRRHKIKLVNGFKHFYVGDTHRDAVQPLRRVEQLGAAIGHGLEILRVDGNVVLVDGYA